MSTSARFRMPRSALVPVAVLAACVVPTAAVASWTVVLLLVPAVVAAWVLRRGADVDDEGITAHELLGSRTVHWTELAGIRIGERGDLWLVTTAATEVRLPVLRPSDLPRLAAASGGRLPAPGDRSGPPRAAQ